MLRENLAVILVASDTLCETCQGRGELPPLDSYFDSPKPCADCMGGGHSDAKVDAKINEILAVIIKKGDVVMGNKEKCAEWVENHRWEDEKGRFFICDNNGEPIEGPFDTQKGRDRILWDRAMEEDFVYEIY